MKEEKRRGKESATKGKDTTIEREIRAFPS